MQAFLNSAESEQIDEIRVLPFFLGPSLAITEWLPENLNLWQRKKPTLRKFSILKPLFSENDDRLARASCELCWDQFKRRNLDRPRVAFVDHGTPLVTVNKVRELVGEKMKKVLGGQVDGFSTCAMERRPDPKYDFNNPLLETLLEQWQKEGVSDVVVSQFFLLPGRHAGPNGDLAEICRPYIEKGMNVVRTDNLGSHPLIEQILLDRINLDKA